MHGTFYSEVVWNAFRRLLGAVLAVHFASLLPQVLRLIGARGLEPARFLFTAIRRDLNPAFRFLRFPSLLLLSTSDSFIFGTCLVGLLAALAIVVDVGHAPFLFLTSWVCWLSIQTGNPTVFSFPWDLLLSECAFLGVFLGARGSPPAFVQFWFNWLLFRVLFGMGLTRFEKRGETKRDWSYVFHFLQWQPMPTPVAYYLRTLPKWVHAHALAFLFVSEVIFPFAIFGTAEMRVVAFVSTALLQVAIWASGNYGTFNLLAIILCIPLLVPIVHWQDILPYSPLIVLSLPSFLVANFWTGTVWLYRQPKVERDNVRWLIQSVVAILRFCAPFRLLNSYGVFRRQDVYVHDRLVVRLQGSCDGALWTDYEPKFLSSSEASRPRFFAPHHPRLDHFLFYGLCEPHSLKLFMLMGCNPHYFHPFCLTEKLVQKLLRSDAVALSFFKRNPFPEGSPRYIRYALFSYEFTSVEEKRASGRWWKAESLGTSDPIACMAVEEETGVRTTYERFISGTQSRGSYSVRDFFDGQSGRTTAAHLHTVRRETSRSLDELPATPGWRGD